MLTEPASPIPLPPLPWHSACQCGQVNYTLHAFPLTLYCCHCTECRKQSASSFGMSMIVRSEDVHLHGTTHAWTRPTDSGNTTDCHFCPHCGCRVYHQGSQRRESGTMTLKAGLLDVIARLRPVGHIWLRSALTGFRPEPGSICHDAQPPDYTALIVRWRQNHGL